MVSGGTDNHLVLVDLTPSSRDLTGQAGGGRPGTRPNITVNKNAIPFDEQPPMVASGIRLGTPALTTRGMAEPEMDTVAELIGRTLSAPEDERVTSIVRIEVERLCRKFPLYPTPTDCGPSRRQESKP